MLAGCQELRQEIPMKRPRSRIFEMAQRSSGDSTRFVSGIVPEAAAIIQTVNRTRLRR